MCASFDFKTVFRYGSLITLLSLPFISSSIGEVNEGHRHQIYFFDEEADGGMALDSSGNGFMVTLRGKSRISTEKPRFGTGSLRIIGKDESQTKAEGAWQVRLGEGPFLNLCDPVGKLTVATWVKAVDAKPFTIFWRIPGSTARPGFFQFALTGDGVLYFSVNNPPGVEGRSSSTSPLLRQFTAGEWTHLAVTFDEGLVTFYENGQQIGASKRIASDRIPSLPARGSSISAFHGVSAGTEIDDYACLFDVALNSDEIQTIYSDGLKEFFSNKQ